jgi:hypothetical protein
MIEHDGVGRRRPERRTGVWVCIRLNAPAPYAIERAVQPRRRPDHMRDLAPGVHLEDA